MDNSVYVSKLEARRVRRYVIWLCLGGIMAMALALAVGTALRPSATPNCGREAQTLTDVFVGCWSGSLGETFVKALTVIVLTFPVNYVIRHLMGFVNDEELRRQQTTTDNNDSPVFISAFGVLALVFLVVSLPFTSLVNYATYLLFKGGYATMLAVVFAFLALRFRCNIKLMTTVLEQMRLEGTNAVAIWIGISACAAAILV